MKSAVLLFLCATAVVAQKPPQEDVVLKAMKDELARARSLRLVDAPPYYIEYSLDDSRFHFVSAVLGSILQDRTGRSRIPRVRVRVGDPKLDNSNHVYSDVFRGSRFDPQQFPLDDQYDVLRLGFWLATDRAYKQAVEAFARKQASLRGTNASESLPDFTAAPPFKLIAPSEPAAIDGAAWRERVRAVSSVFLKYPQVLNSDAAFSSSQTTSYFVNNEGSEVRIPDNAISFRIKAYAIAPDGMVVRDWADFVAAQFNALPSEADMKRAAEQVAANVEAGIKAPVGESYSGPVLIEKVAAAQFMAEVLGRQFTVARRPVTDPDRPVNIGASDLEGRVGSRILPEWMDVVDDPTQQSYQSTPLVGFYRVDIEGVAPTPLTLVEKGVLKGYLTTRQPIPGGTGLTGHARIPGALQNNVPLAGNLFIKSSQVSTSDALRQRLLEMGKARSKPYVIVIRKMDFPSTAQLDDLRRIASNASGRPISIPLLCYRLYPDGREELVRGLRLRGANVRALKDIVAASDEQSIFQFMENGAPFAHMEGGNYVALTSVIAPSLLFEDLELERIPGDWPKPPIVPAPPISSR